MRDAKLVAPPALGYEKTIPSYRSSKRFLRDKGSKHRRSLPATHHGNKVEGQRGFDMDRWALYDGLVLPPPPLGALGQAQPLSSPAALSLSTFIHVHQHGSISSVINVNPPCKQCMWYIGSLNRRNVNIRPPNRFYRDSMPRVSAWFLSGAIGMNVRPSITIPLATE